MQTFISSKICCHCEAGGGTQSICSRKVPPIWVPKSALWYYDDPLSGINIIWVILSKYSEIGVEIGQLSSI